MEKTESHGDDFDRFERGDDALYQDGNTPSRTNGVWINGTSGTTTILANTSVTLKAIAYGAAYKDSGITSALFDRVGSYHDLRRAGL